MSKLHFNNIDRFKNNKHSTDVNIVCDNFHNKISVKKANENVEKINVKRIKLRENLSKKYLKKNAGGN